MKTPYYACLLLFLKLITMSNALAEDSLSTIMQKMKSSAAVKIAYKETRILELMDQPWLGSGFMYSSQPDIMIKEQLQPEWLLMGIKDNTMLYVDPEKNIRHQSEIDNDDPLSLNIAVFKALINADEDLLNKLYSIEFFSNPVRWTMRLRSKKTPQSDFNIVVSGLAEQRIDTIIINQEDGDVSEFSLQKHSQGKAIDTMVDKLYQQLKGK